MERTRRPLLFRSFPRWKGDAGCDGVDTFDAFDVIDSRRSIETVGEFRGISILRDTVLGDELFDWVPLSFSDVFGVSKLNLVSVTSDWSEGDIGEYDWLGIGECDWMIAFFL